MTGAGIALTTKQAWTLMNPSIQMAQNETVSVSVSPMRLHGWACYLPLVWSAVSGHALFFPVLVHCPLLSGQSNKTVPTPRGAYPMVYMECAYCRVYTKKHVAYINIYINKTIVQISMAHFNFALEKKETFTFSS